MSATQPSRFHVHARVLLWMLSISILSILAQPIRGADRIWNGGGADNNWNTALNWGGTVPQANDALFFDGLARPTAVNNLTADLAFAGITFNSEAAAFTLSGNRITLNGSVTNNATTTQTLALALKLDASQIFNTAAGQLTISGVISGNGGLIKTGPQTLVLSGGSANTFSGLTVVNQGVLRLDKTIGVAAIGGHLEITSGGQVTFIKHNQLTSTTAVTLSGAGSVLNGTGVNTGATGNTVQTIGSLTMTGGTFNTSGGGTWTINGTASFTGGADNTLFLGNSGSRLTVERLVITGMSATAGSNVGMANSFTLYGQSAAQTYLHVGSGGLELNASRINLRRGSATDMFGSLLILDGDVTTTGNAASFITEDTSGGTIGVVQVHLSNETAATERTFTINSGADLTINVAITNGSSSSAGLIKNGTGQLILSGGHANTYTGTTTINGGTLRLSQTSNVTAIAGDIVVNSGGTLQISAHEQIANTAGITVNGGTIAALSITETFAFYTQNSGGLTSSGNTGQITITGALTLNGGSQFTINSLASATPAHFRANSVVLSGADILIGGNNGSNPRSQLTVGNGGLTLANGRKITLNYGSAGTVLNLEGNFTGTGTNSIVVGDSGAAAPQLNLGSETRTFDVAGTTTINVAIVGDGGLTKTGTGTLILNGNLSNTYTGTTTISGGVLNLNQTGDTQAIQGPIVVNSGGTLTIANHEQIADNTGITVNGGTISSLNRNETIAYYTQNSGGLSSSGNTGQFTVTGTVTLNGGTVMTLSSSGTTPSIWNFNRLVLNGADVLSGGNNGAGNPKNRLIIGSGGLSLAHGRRITLNYGTAGVVMELNGDVTATGTNGIYTSTPALNDVAAELHLGDSHRTFDIAGETTIQIAVLGNGGLIKTGSGSLILNAASSYSGGTQVLAGTLHVTNGQGSATGLGPLSVVSGATLSGTGRVIAESMNIQGTLRIGSALPSSGETLTLYNYGDDALSIHGTIHFDLFGGHDSTGLNVAGTHADQLVLISDAGVMMGENAILKVTTSIPIQTGNAANWQPGSSWQLFDWGSLGLDNFTGSFSNITNNEYGNFANLPDLSPLGYYWDVSQLYTAGIITVTIPEPGRILLGLIGLLSLTLRRRR